MEKQCKGPCGLIRLKTDFSKRASAKDGRQSWCKQCMKERKRVPEQQRTHILKHRYGLTVEQWDQMLIEQSGLCALCDEQMQNPHIDHSHISGKVRGLLCLRCNTMLGHVERVSMIRIEAYLERGFLSHPLEGNETVWEAVYCGFLSSSYN
jgi:hypothetical protein